MRSGEGLLSGLGSVLSGVDLMLRRMLGAVDGLRGVLLRLRLLRIAWVLSLCVGVMRGLRGREVS
jgi:hypothetical protein